MQQKLFTKRLLYVYRQNVWKKSYGPEMQKTTKCSNYTGSVIGSKYPNNMNEAQHQSMQPCELDCEDRSWMHFAQDYGRTTRSDITLFKLPAPPVYTNAVP